MSHGEIIQLWMLRPHRNRYHVSGCQKQLSGDPEPIGPRLPTEQLILRRVNDVHPEITGLGVHRRLNGTCETTDVHGAILGV